MIDLEDYGTEPYVVDIENLAEENEYFRVTKWTGNHLQVTVMCIQPGEEVGLEVHQDRDQFLRIEEGSGKAVMGPSETELNEWEIGEDWAVLVPAGTWHNIVNTGEAPLQFFVVYSPAEHAKGTVHKTKAEANTEENEG